MTRQEDTYGQNAARRTRKSVRWTKVSTAQSTSENSQDKDSLKRLSVDIDGELLFKFRQITFSQHTTIREEVTRFVENYVAQHEENTPQDGWIRLSRTGRK